MRLWDLRKGDVAVVQSVDQTLPSSYQQRLCELGFYPDTEITCLRTAPFGGPKAFSVAGTVFSLAEDIATHVIVERAK